MLKNYTKYNSYIENYSNYNKVLNQTQAHGYHLVDPSPWPVVSTIATYGWFINIALLTNGYINNPSVLLINSLVLAISILIWTKDIVQESTYQGKHTSLVKNGLLLGFILFIISEAMFFVGIFWAYGHSALNPVIELGSQWPPVGIQTIGPFDLPLFNTIVLLASGATITYCHHALIANDYYNSLYSLIATVLLAILFTACQYIEYTNCLFTISDSVFGSTFFLGTGFHAYHILTGTVFISVCIIRLYKLQFNPQRHINLLVTIWLWHFLDIVWLFLFVIFYYWGS